ncbi:hypothetical protein IRJ41_018178, partial [Triplophysa rosa]
KELRVEMFPLSLECVKFTSDVSSSRRRMERTQGGAYCGRGPRADLYGLAGIQETLKRRSPTSQSSSFTYTELTHWALPFSFSNKILVWCTSGAVIRHIVGAV